jgi:transposase
MGKNSIKPAPEPEGRPSKFTPERCADIISAISRRAPYQLAAEANGISERTLFYWLEEGVRDLDANVDSEHAQFLQSIKRAEMQKVMEHTDMIAAKPERWQADAWLLERRWPKHFGANAQVNELNERLARLETGEGKSE